MLYDEELSFGFPLAPLSLDLWRTVSPHLVSKEVLTDKSLGENHYLSFNDIRILAMPLSFPMLPEERAIMSWICNYLHNSSQSDHIICPFKLLNLHTSCFNLPNNKNDLVEFFRTLDPNSPSIMEPNGITNRSVLLITVTWPAKQANELEQIKYVFSF